MGISVLFVMVVERNLKTQLVLSELIREGWDGNLLIVLIQIPGVFTETSDLCRNGRFLPPWCAPTLEIPTGTTPKLLFSQIMHQTCVGTADVLFSAQTRGCKAQEPSPVYSKSWIKNRRSSSGMSAWAAEG